VNKEKQIAYEKGTVQRTMVDCYYIRILHFLYHWDYAYPQETSVPAESS